MTLLSKFIYGATTCLLVAAGIWAFVALAPQSQKPQEVVFTSAGASLEPSSNATTTSLGLHRTPPAGQKEYYNAQYRFSLFYPDNLHMEGRSEGEGAMTVIFQNPDTAQGFQIFIAPYGEAQVTEEQFKKDEPSGVRKDMRDISIDGTTGASFYSTNLALGGTAEIWFVHGGYLYEVTTLKPLGSWLESIMQSWNFI